ncbi:hypothetical protein C8D88_101999 [Lentzea atacamensis]|uniref:Uncharacterized protein n=1 Tax=Lentzea atacamensis TaxID=531938 RepID=A0A316ICH9_9PSEU|nr:hypothetical protein C8D88_101999 [Lentzea atacamensis]
MYGGFWDSWRGREIRWRERWLRTRLLQIEGEPEQKGRRGGRKRSATTQHRLIDQLAERRWRAFTGPVALDIDFHVGASQPPAIHRLAKYLLDVLGPALPGVDRRRRHVLYRDDRQVKLLYVRIWRSRTASDKANGRTMINARPLRDVVEDMNLLRDVRDCGNCSYLSTDGDDGPFRTIETPEIDPESAFDVDLAASPEQAEEWAELNDWLKDHDRAGIQEAILLSAEAHLASVLCAAPHWIEGACAEAKNDFREALSGGFYDELVRIGSEYRRMLLSEPIAFPLPGLPGASGESGVFKAEVLQALELLLRRRPFFDPLLVPLKVSFLVVPPKQGKDLDNVALTLLPLLHEVLQPNLESWLMRRARRSHEGLSEVEGASRGQQSMSDRSVVAYEVIELKRGAGDPPEGHLCLALGSGSEFGSIWVRVADYVERFMRDL